MLKPLQPLDLFSATTLVAASMIGVGVYTTSGFTLAALGTPERVIAAWIVSGLIAICGALGYASLASRFAESGGEYLFLSKMLHPVAGLMAGWVSLLAGFTGAIAIAALGLETYLKPILFDSPETPYPGSIAITVVLLAAVLHTIGVRAAARAQDLVVAIKAFMIVAFIAFAVFNIDRWSGFSQPLPAGTPPFDWLVFANQLVWISFSYAGFNAAVYVAGEVRDAERNVPRALIGGTVLVTVIYVMLNTIFVYAAPVETITADQNIAQIAATAARSIGGDTLTLAVRLVIVISLFTSVSALVMTGPRVYAKMAEDGFFPSRFLFDERVPSQAIWFQAALAIAVILSSDLKDLLGYLGLTLSVCSALTVSMLFFVRRRDPSIKMIFYGIPAVLYVAGTFLLATLYAIREPKQTIATVVTICLGFVLYPFIGKRVDPAP